MFRQPIWIISVVVRDDNEASWRFMLRLIELCALRLIYNECPKYLLLETCHGFEVPWPPDYSLPGGLGEHGSSALSLGVVWKHCGFLISTYLNWIIYVALWIGSGERNNKHFTNKTLKFVHSLLKKKFMKMGPFFDRQSRNSSILKFPGLEVP